MQSHKPAARKPDFGNFLDGLVFWMETIGIKLPDVTAKTTKVLGSLIFSGVDILSGGLALSWVFSQLTPVEFQGTAKLIAWGLSIALFFVVRSLIDDGDQIWWSGKSLFGWGLNLIDSFVDAFTAFILFGLGSFILQPGLAAFVAACKAMPLLGWVIWGMLFVISLSAEHWREAMKPAKKLAPAPASQPQPATPTGPNPAKIAPSAPAGWTPIGCQWPDYMAFMAPGGVDVCFVRKAPAPTFPRPAPKPMTQPPFSSPKPEPTHHWLGFDHPSEE